MIEDRDPEEIVAQLIQRHASKNPSNSNKANANNGMQVYVKPQMDDDNWFSAGKKNSKGPKAKPVVSEGKTSIPDSDAASSKLDGPPGTRPKGKNSNNKTKKGGKGMSLAEAQEGKLFISRGVPCSCQATRHRLINNCLSCGKIVCEQEGEGPCNFCGALVLVEGSTYGGLDGGSAPISESEAAALAFKDRLVEYGRNSSQRTTVIDDQSDYFQLEETKWLSEEEKQAVLKLQEDLQAKEEARKKKLVVSIDLLGRKVVMAEDQDSEINIKTSILDGIPLVKQSNDVRIKPNPCLEENPVFLNIPKPKGSTKKKSNNAQTEILDNTGRVQHDDPFSAAFGSDTLYAHNNIRNESWKTPKLKDKVPLGATEDEECMMSSEVHKDVFDICLPPSGKRHSLAPSSLAMKQTERKQNTGKSSSVTILKPGLVLLKNWLGQDDQVKIVQMCRDIGMGEGGFYKPGYGSDSKLRLWMMCLGMHWEPSSNSYQKQRPFDNSTPPPIPGFFTNLAGRSLREAQNAVKAHEKGNHSGGNMIPHMRPDICLVNFYEQSGRLGMHQDKDESRESLHQGLPIVSFSIGDSAEFIYGVNRDENSAETIILESGDVLIFGGPSRMIYHGVQSILTHTAPSWLIDKTNLRPGRMNLTFRQI